MWRPWASCSLHEGIALEIMPSPLEPVFVLRFQRQIGVSWWRLRRRCDAIPPSHPSTHCMVPLTLTCDVVHVKSLPWQPLSCGDLCVPGAVLVDLCSSTAQDAHPTLHCPCCPCGGASRQGTCPSAVSWLAFIGLFALVSRRGDTGTDAGVSGNL